MRSAVVLRYGQVSPNRLHIVDHRIGGGEGGEHVRTINTSCVALTADQWHIHPILASDLSDSVWPMKLENFGVVSECPVSPRKLEKSETMQDSQKES